VSAREPAFRFVVAAYAAEPWIRRCLRSIQRQTVRSFRCMVVDDQSPDGTFEAARDAVAGDERFVVERAARKAYALGNRVRIVREIATDRDDVLVVVDGDDWLAHDRVLETLSRAYADPDVWMTYGSHRRWKNKLLHRIGWTKRRGIAEPYPPGVLRERSFRDHPFLASHLRTFKRFLFNAIHDGDLREADGSYYAVGGDVADTVPMLEMAGPDHIQFIEEVLYVYNGSNALSDHRVNRDAQVRVHERIRSRPRYPLLRRDAASGD
jgi:glycosyltransferase involved in cell wall biosynthesis